MSNRPTPETDALDCELHNPRVLQDRYSEMMEHAQKLERERDELQKAVNGLCDHLEVSPANTTLLAVEVLKIERERDEAREAFVIATDQMVIAQGKVREANKERDEARAVAGELADIASKYLSFLLAITPTKANETHEKDTMRVIDALKRWKKL
jgi:cell division septum initiation protein DivIVA